MRTEFSLSELEHLSFDLFALHWLPSSGSTGHSGGILLGVKDATFEVGSMDRGEFFVSMEVFERALNFKWEIIAVYGPADHRRSEAFLAELRRKVTSAQLPVVVGGDFNLIRTEEDKSNNLVNFPRMQMFNDYIANMGLRELDRVGARFTWTNRQVDPTRSVLDRVFAYPEWDIRCPLASLWAITRIGSDHVPLLLSSEDERPPLRPRFRFETFWLRQPGFTAVVVARWREARDAPHRALSAVDSWHFCAERSRQFMKGWGANVGRDICERKKALLEGIQALDLRADAAGLSADEWMLRYDLEDQLMVIYLTRRHTGAYEVIKPEVMALFDEFFVGSIDLARLNYGVITLIPKVAGASDIRQFRPITVINVIFRILAKGYAIRAAPITDRITHPDQSAFIQGRYILDGVLVFHEALHEVHSKHLKAVFLKLDFHKAYDTVSWTFLRECLLRKGFDDRWVTRVMQMVSSGRTAVNINGEFGPFFPTFCGVRQGDPFSPFLFNMVVDALAAILDNAKAASHIKGIVPHLVGGGDGVSLLQYADDTIIMVEGSESDISNLKFLLPCFQQMAGLKINFDKSEVMVLGYTQEECKSIADWLNCHLGCFPTTYLGIPISDSRLTVAELRPTVGKLQHQIEPWQGRWLSKAARTVLINSSLSSLLLFIMSFYSLPKTLHHDIATVQGRFFWAGEGDKQKYHMVRWSEICKPRDHGGLGIMSSKRMNIALLTKWLWRIANGEGGLWLRMIQQKYLRGQPLAFCQRSGGSQFWQSIIQLLPISVETALIDLGQLAFRRPFGPAEIEDWQELLDCIALHEPELSTDDDRARWRLEPFGQFSTKSLYLAIAPPLGHEVLSSIWEIRLPLKIRIFLWQWIRGRLPSGVEVLKRNGPGDGRYPLCGPEEDLNHIFFTCVSAQFLWSCFHEIVGGNWDHNNFPALFAELQAIPPALRHTRWLTIGVLAWMLWTVRNKLVIQHIPLRRATDTLFKWSGYLQLWRPLSRPRERDAITSIITQLRAMALRLAPPLPPPPPEPD
ncbi:uncharacterized protein [Aegilops tauschii subsp. strangulata]|uniref:uncharacterized protein n=1 Tax=Aegilops tauschii subsp. strangulata TaxID=200361 RepID=UPI003CC88C9F